MSRHYNKKCSQLCLYSVNKHIIFPYLTIGATFNYRYGTSGFRGHHKAQDSVMVRMSFMAILRSLSLNGKTVGLMITASHNKECDNGVKVIDSTGEMLHQSWESIATQIANIDEKQLRKYLHEEIFMKECLNKTSKLEANVFIGRDTRPHSKRFSELVIEAANTIIDCSVNVRDFGEITTPQLHYFVMKQNTNENESKINVKNEISPEIYINDITHAFIELMQLLSINNKDEQKNNNCNISDESVLGEVIVDCANGVGGLLFKQAVDPLQSILHLSLIHLPSSDFAVNEECGAEHVHKQLLLPCGLQDMEKQLVNKRLASVDGDCDRLIYYSMIDDMHNHRPRLCLLDGDKQICLIFTFIQSLIKQSQLCFSTAVLQTAYANGSSKEYLSKVLNVENIICTPTGVKHLHASAKKYEIAIYFESNGHGTLLIQSSAIQKLNDETGNKNESVLNAVKQLLLIARIANQAIGDAFADLLLVEMSLHALKWSINDWIEMYKDRPSMLTKLRVEDRTVFQTTNAEQTCIKPSGLQSIIDKLCFKYENSRCFVRPSGTEDCVRVYSEAQTIEDATMLNLLVRQAVYDTANGVGQRPI